MDLKRDKRERPTILIVLPKCVLSRVNQLRGYSFKFDGDFTFHLAHESHVTLWLLISPQAPLINTTLFKGRLLARSLSNFHDIIIILNLIIVITYRKKLYKKKLCWSWTVWNAFKILFFSINWRVRDIFCLLFTNYHSIVFSLQMSNENLQIVWYTLSQFKKKTFCIS